MAIDSKLAADFPGMDGFLGTRGSLMLDLVFLAMFISLPAMAVSVMLVRYRNRYALHKRIQMTMGVVLLIAVLAFEVDMRITGWTPRAEPSPFWSPGVWNDWIDYSLAAHLVFAIPTPFLWAFTIVQAARRFPNPPGPGQYSLTHRRLGRVSAMATTLTAVTGWIFYWLAFVAQ